MKTKVAINFSKTSGRAFFDVLHALFTSCELRTNFTGPQKLVSFWQTTAAVFF